MTREETFNELVHRASQKNLYFDMQGKPDGRPYYASIVTNLNMDGRWVLEEIRRVLGGDIEHKTRTLGVDVWVAYRDEAAGIIHEIIPYMKRSRDANVKVKLYYARKTLKAWTKQQMENSDAQRILQEESEEQDED